jgi:hypothetical protein
MNVLFRQRNVLDRDEFLLGDKLDNLIDPHPSHAIAPSSDVTTERTENTETLSKNKPASGGGLCVRSN